MSAKKEIEKIKNIEEFEKVQFIILYGSAAREALRDGSDIDLCVYYDGTPEEASKFRLNALAELFNDEYDIQIFQQLPLYVRKEVLKGKVVYCKDTRLLYAVVRETIRDFEEFEDRFYDYIGERAIIWERELLERK